MHFADPRICIGEAAGMGWRCRLKTLRQISWYSTGARLPQPAHLSMAVLSVVSFLSACLLVLPALAQSGDLRSGGLNPFPKDDVYRLHMFGDWFMDGLEPSLKASLKTLPRVQLQDEKVDILSLRRSSWEKSIDAINARRGSVGIDMAIVMFGVSEIGSLFASGRERQSFGSEAWLKGYAARVDKAMKALRASKGAVYWIGLPVVRRRDHSEAYQIINTLLRERAYANGVTYIDIYSRFQDENGAFNRYGPDLDGAIKLMRSKDGVYFSGVGYAKITYLAMQMIRRDLNRVKAERVVSLAGNEAEQRSVRRVPSTAKARQAGQANRKKSSRPIVPGARNRGMRYNGQVANDGSFQFDAIVDNASRKVRLELPRPALSAAVMALVTRNQSKDKAARLGDNAVQVIEGGVPLFSTVTPADQSALALSRRRLSPTQSVFFKVWGKGERLEPKPGRADDYRWPRPEPQPVLHVAARPQSDRAGKSAKADAARDPSLPPLPVPGPYR